MFKKGKDTFENIHNAYSMHCMNSIISATFYKYYKQLKIFSDLGKSSDILLFVSFY